MSGDGKIPVAALGGRSQVNVGARRLVDHELLAIDGLDERTEAGRNRVVEVALEAASRAGVVLGDGGAEDGALRAEQRPPAEFPSNAAWAADVMVSVARAYARDEQEGANAVEGVFAGERALRGALGTAVRYFGGAAGQEETSGELRDRVVAEWPEWQADLGDAGSRFASARAMLRAHLFASESPVVDVLQPAESRARVDAGAYGETLGGCVAWHLAEASPAFRGFAPRELAGVCEEIVVAQAANELLERSGLMSTQDAAVGFGCPDPEMRVAFERHGVYSGSLSQLGTLVSERVLREREHPLDPPRPVVENGGVEPVGFRPLDGRWPGAEEAIVDRVLSVCSRSGVALQLTGDGPVKVSIGSVSEARDGDPWPDRGRYGSYAAVTHPVAERFGSVEEWGRSVLEATAAAVVTHPRLANQVQLHGLCERWGGGALNDTHLFGDALQRVCTERGLDRRSLVEEAVLVSHGESCPSVAALREEGAPVPDWEVDRRAMWLALEKVASQGVEGDVTGFREAMAAGHSDYRVAGRVLQWYDELDELVKPDERWKLVGERSLGDSVWEPGWRPLDGEARDGVTGEVERSRAAVGAVDRAVAVLAADRILDRLGVAGERIDFESARPGSRTREFVASLEGVDGQDVLGRVRVLASNVVDFIRDDERAERWDRRGDVLHSLGVNPWADAERVWLSDRGTDVPVRERQASPALER